MKRKWILIGLALVTMISLFAGCASAGKGVKQTASAKQTVGENGTAVMTVDLTDGYSVEFASGAAYFYKGEASDENEVAAYAYVISKEEYDEEIAYLTADRSSGKDFKDLGDGVFSDNEEESCVYFFPTEDGLFMKVAVQKAGMNEAKSIFPRFSAHNE